MAAFSRENSGTYNNEWHVIDYKLFSPGQPLRPGTLWVLDQLPGPGNIVAADHTGFLLPGNQSYWASYNRISVPRLYELANQTALVAAYGQHFTYANTSRARIFRRDQVGMVDVRGEWGVSAGGRHLCCLPACPPATGESGRRGDPAAPHALQRLRGPAGRGEG